MPAKKKFRVTHVALTASGWTPIIAPMPSSRCLLANNSAAIARYRDNPDDGGTEKEIAATTGELDINTYGRGLCDVNEIIGYAQAASGTGPLICLWTA